MEAKHTGTVWIASVDNGKGWLKFEHGSDNAAALEYAEAEFGGVDFVKPEGGAAQQACDEAAQAKRTVEYEVTEEGKVYSFAGWRGQARREIAPIMNARGYLEVRMMVGGKRKNFRVHCLVAQKFCGPRPSPSHEVCHINGIKTDNRATNLRWGTRQDNMADRDLHGHTSRGAKHSEAIKRGIYEGRAAKATEGAA